MTDIIIEDKVCWKCGKEFTSDNPKTIHHALPQVLQPAHNVKIPLHANCHEIMTSMDMSALTTFAFKLHKEAIQLESKVGKLTKLLEVK